MYCCQKRLRLEAQQRRVQVSEAAAPLPDYDRQGPLSSAVRVRSLAEEDHMIENCDLVFALDGFIFHSDEDYRSTGAKLVEGARKLSSEVHSSCERRECNREPRVQFQGNSFEQDENIGQAR
jgi:hypothetical protein